MAEERGEIDPAWAVVEAINRCWLEGRVEDLRRHFHPDLTMAFPGFSGTAEGAEAILAGFREFTENATVERFEIYDRMVHAAGGSAVVVFAFEMIYTRDGESHRSTGRDLWVLSNGRDGWQATWRTMLDLRDEPLGDAPS